MVASLILLAVANSFPLLTFKLAGREQVATIATGAIELYRQGYWELGILVFLLSIGFPFVCIATGLYVLIPLRIGRTPLGLARTFRVFVWLLPWAMTEVYLLGLIVAYVKLSDLATLVIGVSVYAFVALIITMTWANGRLDSRIVWRWVDRATLQPPAGQSTTCEVSRHYLACHCCNLLLDAEAVHPSQGRSFRCPRCGSTVHKRKPDSLARTWALLVAALICYLPANLLPIMTVISFGKGEPDTIISGVKALIEFKMYPVALLVFFASICVPVLKILILGFLLLSIQRSSGWRTRERSILYRITEAIGRWSMIDIFMISILAALVKLDTLATISPGPAAVFFAAVVILTMFAAMAFDPRLIWDAAARRPVAHAE
jgi:paraquat-inducible protein A